MKLTTKTIKALQPTERRREIKDDGCRGLYLLIQPSGQKGWAVRYFLDGKVRKATIGSFPKVGLAEARIAAGKIFEQLAGNVDPRETERQAAAEAKAARTRTFGAVARRYLADSQHLRTIRATESMLRPVMAEWEDRPVASIRRRDVIALVDTIKVTRGPYAAVKTQGSIRRIFSWLVEKDELEASPLVGMKRPAPVRVRERVLSDDEVKRLWITCEQRSYPGGRFIQMLLLSACRRAELATLQWSDVDLIQKIIVIPGDRYKTGKPHLVALSRQAQALLESLPRFDGPYVFTTTGGEKPVSGFGWLKGNIDALIDPPIAYALHDLRRTTRTGLSRLRVAPHVAERVLGHTQRGMERHYDMHLYATEKMQALQLWADHISRLVWRDYRPERRDAVAALNVVCGQAGNV